MNSTTFLPLILLTLFYNFSIGQTYQFEGWYFSSIEKIQYAKQNNIKVISVYSFKKQTDQNPKLYSEETYDTSGAIISMISHHYYKYKDLENRSYFYNKNQQLIRIKLESSFSDGYYNDLQIGYKSGGQLSYIAHGWGKENSMRYDTLFYSFNEQGKIDYKYFRSRMKDTMYYHYHSNGNMLYISRSRGNSDNYVINKNGCILSYKDTSESKITVTCDSLCNILTYKEEMFLRNKWTPIFEGKYNYVNGMNTETKNYSCNRTILSRCRGKLVFNDHTQYQFNENGQINSIISLSRKGKVKEIKKYNYLTF